MLQWLKKDGRPRSVGTLFDDAVVMLEERVMLDAVPSVTIVGAEGGTANAATQSVLLKAPSGDFTATLRFDNTSVGTTPTDVGYGPYLELIVPKLGTDGSFAMPANNDGITFNSATYLGSAVTAVVNTTFDAAGHATNTLTGDVVNGTPGQQFVVLQLPFGSYTPDQTPADIVASFTLSGKADLGVPLALQARAGFQYGTSATGNPPTDHLVNATFGTTDTVTPTLMMVTKASNAPSNKEAEVGTGPNQPLTYTINVDIADGQTLTNIDITDLLPSSVHFLGATVTSGSGTVTATPTATAADVGVDTTGGHNSLIVHFNSVTGTASTSDAQVQVTFYVAKTTFAGAAVIDPNTGATTVTTNTASATATWHPFDVNDPDTTFTVMSNPHIIQNQPIVIQKTSTIVADTGPTGLSPGDTVEYTLNIQVSDYFTLGNISLNDVLSDGQVLQTTGMNSAPQLTVIERGVTLLTGDLPGFTVGPNVMGDAGTGVTGTQFGGTFLSTYDKTTGATTSLIDISAALAATPGFLGVAGVLSGGRVGTNAAGTTIQLKFRAVVQNNFESDTLGANDRAVDQGDSIGNNVVLSGSIRDNTAGTTTLNATSAIDDAFAGMTIAKGALVKAIYAVNGNTTLPVVDGQVQLKAGDLITYRLTYSLPITSFENLNFTDFLPLPVLLAGNLTLTTAIPAATAPGQNLFSYGPSDSYHLLTGATTPSESFVASANSVKFSYPNYSQQNVPPNANTTTTVDLLFTLRIQDTAFADGLFLTNLATSNESNTQGNALNTNGIVQIQLSQPNLLIQKAIVSASSGTITNPQSVAGLTFGAPGSVIPYTNTGGALTDARLGLTLPKDTKAAPNIDSNVIGLDGGDSARVALVINNEGSNNAFDVRFGDVLPTGVVFAGAGGLVNGGGGNLVVTRGDGTLLVGGVDYTVTTSTATGFQITLANNYATHGNSGIGRDGATDGSDIVLVTYDVRLADAVAITPAILTSNGSINNFTALAGGTDISLVDPMDAATIGLAAPTTVKTLVSTSVPDAVTAGSALSIGETATFTITYTLPEGTIGAVRLADFLPGSNANGRYEIVSATITGVGANLFEGNGVTALTAGSFGAGVLSNSNGPSSSGTTYNDTVKFGGAGGITVVNAANNVMNAGDQITLTVVVRAPNDSENSNGDNGNNIGQLVYGAANTVINGASPLSIAVPVLTVTKTTPTPNPTDTGAAVTFNITVAHAVGSGTDAFDLNFSDMLPPGLTNLVVTGVSGNTGLTTANFTSDGTTVTFAAGTQGIFDLAKTQTFTLTVTANVDPSAQAGATYINIANIDYSTANGTVMGERTGIMASGNASVTIPVLLSKSFDPNNAVTTANAGIGSTYIYYLNATLPEGTTNALTITDVLPTGLTYISSTVSAGVKVTAPAPMVTQNGQTVTFTFGTITDLTDALTQTTADRIQIAITVKVNDPGGTAHPVRGDTLSNTFNETTQVGGVPTMAVTSNSVVTTVVDPLVSITKIVNTPTTATSGDTVQFTSVITASNAANTANAEDVIFTDLLGGGATLTGPVVIDGISIAPGASGVVGGVTVTVVASGSGFFVRFGELTVAGGVNHSHTLVYNATIAAAAGTTVNSAATVTYDAINSGGNSVGDGQGDHDQTASATAPVGTVAFTKAFVATSTANGGATQTDPGTGGANDQVRPNVQDLAIGETVDLRFVVTIPAGARTLSISDLLSVANANPALAGRLTYDSLVSTTPSAGVVLASSTVNTPDTDHAAINFTTTAGSTAGTVTFVLRAHVTNTAANATGDMLDLPATLTYSAAPPVGVVGTLGATASVDLVEPVLATVKSVVAGTPNAGDTVSYTVVVTNSGNAAAFDVLISDPAPTGITYGAATLVLSGGGGTTNPASAASVAIPVLLAGQTATLTYTATVGNGVVTGSTVTNTATTTASSMPGMNTFERAEPTTTSSANFVTEATQGLVKTTVTTGDANTGTAAVRAGITDLAIGETVTFDLRINLSEGTTNTVSLSDVLTTAQGTLSYVPGSAVVQTANGATFTGSVTPTVVGNNLVFTLGNVTLPGDNDAGGVNNFIVIRYQAVVPVVAANVAGKQLDLPATLTTALSPTLGSPVSSQSADIVEPLLSIDKQIATSDPTPNAGDTVTYTVIVANNGNGPAYSVNIADPLPAGLTYSGNPSLTLSMGGGTTTPGNAASVTVATLLPGQTATLTYSATIDNTAVTGVPINNTATIAASGTTPGGGGRPGPMPSDSTSFTVEALQGLTKAISATSDPNTGTGAYRAGAPDLHVGEVATFDLTVRLTEGSTNTVVLTDKLQLPAGTLTLVSPPTIVTANGVTFTGPGAAGYTLTDTDGDGVPDTITMNFGTVTLPGDNITTNNFFVVRYTAVVADRPENQAGKMLDPAATLTTSVGNSTATAPADIVAPALTLAKSAAAGFVSRGDTVNYTITLSNAGTSPAYDLSLADVLPAGLSYVPNTTTLTVGGVTTNFVSPNAVTFAMLGSGQTGIVAYQVRVDAAVAAAAAYTNTATVSFDALSGPGGRAGTASGSATITTPTNVIALSKSIVSTSIPETGTAQFRPGVTDVNIGERAVIDLTASFTEGNTGTVVITDQLPLTGRFQLVGTPTLTYFGGTTSTVPGTVTYTDTDGDGLADRITFTFGTVTVPVDGDPTNNLIRIRYEVLVPDVASNAPGTALASPAMLTTAAGNAAASILADVVAPNVTIGKAVSAGSADAGDVKAYTVTIANAGSGPAFDLTIADTLPAGLTAVAGTTVLTVGGVSTTYASPAAVPLASLGVGQSAVLSFNAVVGDGVVAGSTLTNGASVAYDSLPGVGGHPGTAAASAGFTTAAVQTLDKSVVATSETFTGTNQFRPGVTDLTIGERVTFEIATSFSEGTTNGVVVTDQLVTAGGLFTFTGTPTLVLGAGITISGSVTPIFVDTNGDGVPDQVRFNLGTVTVPGDNIATNNFVRIRYDAVLSNVPGNVAGGQPVLPAMLVSSTGSLTASAPIDIVAPLLTVSKTLASDQPTDGQTTAFLLTVGHAAGSTASATNIVLTEMLPAGARLAGATIVGAPAGTVVSGNVITIPQLDLGQTVVIRISTAVDFAAPPTGDTINRVGVAYGTVSGTVGGGRLSAGASQAILPFGNPTTTLPGMLDMRERTELGSIGSYLDARYVEDFPEIDPIYSGSAQPGTFVSITVSDEAGSASGFGTGLADAGGNWLVRLPSTTVSNHIERSRFDRYYDGSRLFRSPNSDLFDDRSLLGFNRLGDRISIGSKPSFGTQIVRINVAGQSSGFDTSFAPAWRDQFFSMEPGLSIGGVFRDRAENAVEGLFESLESPEAAGLNRFNHEFLATADL